MDCSEIIIKSEMRREKTGREKTGKEKNYAQSYTS
jgi:hypothetical protein